MTNTSEEKRKQEAVNIGRYRDMLRREIHERIASEGARSRCAFSGQGTCSGPDHSHPCLAALRSRYAGASRTIRALKDADPASGGSGKDGRRPTRPAHGSRLP